MRSVEDFGGNIVVDCVLIDLCLGMMYGEVKSCLYGFICRNIRQNRNIIPVIGFMLDSYMFEKHTVVIKHFDSLSLKMSRGVTIK